MSLHIKEFALKIVDVDLIPSISDIIETPKNDLIDLYKKCLEMANLCVAENGVGLSATQVGIPWKTFVVKWPNDKFGFFIDCEYEPLGEKQVDSDEGCLSLRDKNGKLKMYRVKRYEKIKVSGKALVPEDKPVLKDLEIELEGFYGIVFQHEIDHHNGILISEIGKPVELWR